MRLIGATRETYQPWGEGKSLERVRKRWGLAEKMGLFYKE